MDDRIEAVARGDCQKLLRDLTLAKAVFQMRTIEAVLCADARSKPGQEMAPQKGET